MCLYLYSAPEAELHSGSPGLHQQGSRNNKSRPRPGSSSSSSFLPNDQSGASAAKKIGEIFLILGSYYPTLIPVSLTLFKSKNQQSPSMLDGHHWNGKEHLLVFFVCFSTHLYLHSCRVWTCIIHPMEGSKSTHIFVMLVTAQMSQ